MPQAHAFAKASAGRVGEGPHGSCAFTTQLCDLGSYRRQRHVSQVRRTRAAVPVRQPYLREDGTLTHVRHTLSCFLRHHTYVRLADRDGAHEYVCVKCGHPLVYPAGTDPFTDRELFTKKVRYRCGLFGHRVQAIATRDGFTEYACGCGHSFLKASSGEKKIRHPLLLFLPRPPGAIPGETMRLCRIRVRRLRPSVLLRGRCVTRGAQGAGRAALARYSDGGLTPITCGFLTPGRVIFWRLLGFLVSLNFGILTAFPVSADRYSA